MPEVEEFHQLGSLGISNHDEVIAELHKASLAQDEVDVGLQVGPDGRIWLCVNGLAFIRFKPNMRQIFVAV